ncbi:MULTISPECIES: hypothetical protein [unclassified Cryobacterium]|uniref:hypothetical protein n=2 Tax=Bacteria TaxID=2 RepID=UPI00106C8518|nr:MULTISPECIES: hypothetical protein [unclassified Cryobacterium]MDY7528426.1 hypothetical protein [Cryobacterium sp. 10C2]MDY7555829.1 hypothetical protein [Cryobacterium sp. 10C3]MEB0003831.1 hypothetical protein [Cryobacterium sp. RTC2.1]MEB0201277.1 hypothetical protein [Cryobacterium sp. 5I3]MEB0286133.1 hypothetical protein [Cryobacterium sp. 10S3]
MSTADAEYNAFGPWVDAVRTLDEVPRLFRDFGCDPTSERLVLKVPRNIPRRDADPTMDLYDHLIIAGSDALTVLSRTGSAYAGSTLPYDAVVAIEDSVDLTDGRLRVYSRDGSVLQVGYNGSSREVVSGFVDMLRDMSLGLGVTFGSHDAATAAASMLTFPVGPAIDRRPNAVLNSAVFRATDADLMADWTNLRDREPELHLYAAHPRERVRATGGFMARVLNLFRPTVLHGAIVCGTDAEVQVLSRRDWFGLADRSELSSSRLIVFLARLESVTVQRHPRYAEASIVTVRSGAARIDVIVPGDSEAERVLLAVAPHSGRSVVD